MIYQQVDLFIAPQAPAKSVVNFGEVNYAECVYLHIVESVKA